MRNSTSKPQEPVNMLIGTSNFANAIKNLEIGRLSWVIQVGPV